MLPTTPPKPSVGDTLRDALEARLKDEARGLESHFATFRPSHQQLSVLTDRWQALVAGEHGTALLYGFGRAVDELFGHEDRRAELAARAHALIDAASPERLEAIARALDSTTPPGPGAIVTKQTNDGPPTYECAVHPEPVDGCLGCSNAAHMLATGGAVPRV